MENRNPIEEIINKTRKIEENNLSNMEHFNSIGSILNTQADDRQLSDKISKLNKQIEDINKLTSDLLNDLSSRNN